MPRRTNKYADSGRDIYSNITPANGQAWVWSTEHGRWIPTDVTGSSGAGAHEILSTTHTDTDETDTEVTGDVLTWDGTQWIAHFPAGGDGIVHYDYVVDSSWTGTDGTTLTLSTMATSKVYTTITAALTAADAENTDISILINEGANAGVYNEAIDTGTGWGTGEDVYIYGEAGNKIFVGLTTGTAWTLSDGSNSWFFKNISFRGGSGGTDCSVKGNATNVSAYFEDCTFQRDVSADFGGASFRRCLFSEGYQSFTGHTPATVAFSDCELIGAMTWVGSMQSHYFGNCIFSSTGSGITQTTADIVNIKFDNCRFAQTSVPAYTVNGAGSIQGLVFSDTCDFAAPPANGNIYFQDHGGMTGVIIGGNFTHAVASTNPYIKSDDTLTQGVFVKANFNRNTSGLYVEDDLGVSITGIFKDSVFACTPPDFAVNLNTGSADCMYVGTGAVGGTDPTEMYVALPQKGVGTPSHDAPEGTPYWDTTGDRLWVNSDGSTSWVPIAIGAVTAASAAEPYVTIGNTATLSAERALTEGHGIDITDGGANSTVTIDVDETELNAATTAAQGVVELATTAETTAGTDTGRVPPVSALPIQIQDSHYVYAVDAVGTDSYAITLVPAIAAYADGQRFMFRAGTANTGAATLNVNGKGAKTIKKLHDQDLATGDIEAGQIVEVAYQSVEDVFQMQSQMASAAAGGASPLTTKGDVWGYSSVDARIPIGANDKLLTADSAQTLGLAWKALSGTYRSYRTYIMTPDAAIGTALTASGAQKQRWKTVDAAVTETVSRVSVQAVTAHGSAGTIIIQKGDTNDEDTVVWSTLYSITLANAAGQEFTASVGSVAGAKLLRLNLNALTGTWTDVSVHVDTYWDTALTLTLT